MKTKTIYLDANATIPEMSDTVINTMVKYSNVGNPSATGNSAGKAVAGINSAKSYFRQFLGISLSEYDICFTSGASESIATSIRGLMEGYKLKFQVIPHIIISRIEHKVVIETCSILHKTLGVEVSLINSDSYSNVLVENFTNAFRPNTALVCCMSANNETGCIQNIKGIVDICKRKKVPVLCDMVQTFGKFPFNMKELGVDVIVSSAHKYGGPKGVGLLVMKSKLLEEYEYVSTIPGSQQNGLRGGTENVAYIMAMATAHKQAMTNRIQKNKVLQNCRKMICEGVKSFGYPTYSLHQYMELKNPPVLSFVFLGAPTTAVETKFDTINTGNPNTLLISVAKTIGNKFCNGILKNDLKKSGIDVSIGSACNSNSPLSSHVIRAMGAPAEIKSGVIRISMLDTIRKKQIEYFLKTFLKCVLHQCAELNGIH
jgi:cysteine desulfurase